MGAIIAKGVKFRQVDRENERMSVGSSSKAIRRLPIICKRMQKMTFSVQPILKNCRVKLRKFDLGNKCQGRRRVGQDMTAMSLRLLSTRNPVPKIPYAILPHAMFISNGMLKVKVFPLKVQFKSTANYDRFQLSTTSERGCTIRWRLCASSLDRSSAQ